VEGMEEVGALLSNKSATLQSNQMGEVEVMVAMFTSDPIKNLIVFMNLGELISKVIMANMEREIKEMEQKDFLFTTKSLLELKSIELKIAPNSKREQILMDLMNNS
jgi:hypothetical protein